MLCSVRALGGFKPVFKGFKSHLPYHPQSLELLQGFKPISFVWMPNHPRLGAESSEALHAHLVLKILLVAFAPQCTVGGRVAVTFSCSMCPMNMSRVLLTIMVRVRAKATGSSMVRSPSIMYPPYYSQSSIQSFIGVCLASCSNMLVLCGTFVLLNSVWNITCRLHFLVTHASRRCICPMLTHVIYRMSVPLLDCFIYLHGYHGYCSRLLHSRKDYPKATSLPRLTLTLPTSLPRFPSVLHEHCVKL